MSKVFMKLSRLASIIPDKQYISMVYRIRMGKSMNWRNPRSFSEKLQWLKVYYRKPELIRLVDKYEMKSYVEECLGPGYTVPTIGLWNSVDEIDFNALPNRFVIKCTHDSGSNILCKDKSKLDYERVKNKLKICLKNNLYYLSREWPYKNVQPRIIAEEYLEDKTRNSLTEYKLFCFGGTVKMVLICKGVAHTDNRTNDFCGVNLNRLPFTSLLPNSSEELEKPACYNELLECAAKLSKGLPQVRVDAYVVGDRIYFGELTLFHNSGLRKYEPDEWDYKIGEWLTLPEVIK